MVTIRQKFQALVAVVTQPTVPLKIFEARVDTCSQCDKIKDEQYCGVCGCNVGNNRVFNLAIYREKLPKWGCKHPYRGLRKRDGTIFGWSK